MFYLFIRIIIVDIPEAPLRMLYIFFRLKNWLISPYFVNIIPHSEFLFV